MIKRKYVIIFLSIYVFFSLAFFSYASLLAPFISKLAPAAASVSSSGAITVPAKVLAGTSTGLNVASWVSLVVPGGAVAKITIAGLCVAGALAADYLTLKGAAWFLESGHNTDGNGNFTRTQTSKIPNNMTPATFLPPTGNPLADGYAPNKVSVFRGMYISKEQAQQAALADCSVHCEGYPKGTPGQPGYQTCSKNCNLVNGYYPGSGEKVNHSAYSASKTGEPVYMYIYFWPQNGIPAYTATYTQPESRAAAEAALAAALASGSVSAAVLGKEGINVAAASLDSANHPVALDDKNKAVIDAALVGSLTETQKTNLEAAGTPNVGDQVLPDSDAEKAETLTAAQIAAAVQAALSNQGLSATQIAAAIAAAQSAATGGLTQAELAETLSSSGLTAAQIAAAVAASAPAALTQAQTKAAVKEAIDDETGITPPVDPVISLPEKLSLTTILNDFWTSVQALPIFNVLNGITINTSGSSNLCINLPSAYGGQKCYNAANVQDELNMIGTVILGLTTVVSFIGIFKG